MRKWIVALIGIALAGKAQATDLTALGKDYFNAWVATQSPEATKDDIEHYLSFLTSDVGHQHLPYDKDGSPNPTGKKDMREGMLFYLGAHNKYNAVLKQIIPAHNAVVITYTTTSSGVHPETKALITNSYSTMELLEIEDGKVSVIRKYEE